MASNTLASNIGQTISDFADIKEAIADKGVAVPSGTKTSRYDDLIRSIRSDTVLNIRQLPTNIPSEWSTFDMPPNFGGIAYGQVRDKFYLFRGREVFIYDFTTENWSQGSVLPWIIREITEYASATSGKYIYIIGGYSVGNYQHTVYRYDTELDVWEQKADCPVGITGACAGSFDRKIIICGGDNTNGTSGDGASYLYDIDTDTWTQAATMPIFTRYIVNSGVMLNGKFYVAGGGDHDSLSTETLYCYDTATNTWTTKAPMSLPRYGVAVATVNNQIYAMGGINRDPSTGAIIYLDLMEIYDPFTDSWQTADPLPVKCTNGMPGTYNGNIYLFGGNQGKLVLQIVQQYKLPVPMKQVTLGDGNYTARFDKEVYHDDQLQTADVEFTLANGKIAFTQNQVSGYIRSAAKPVLIEDFG